MKMGNKVAPEKQMIFISTPPVKHSYGTIVEVSAVRKKANGLIIKGLVVFGFANGVLLSLKVSPPMTTGRRFFDGIFGEMVQTAEKAILHIHGKLPEFSVGDYKTFF